VKLTAELSLYPLQEEYIPVIQHFIEAARRHANVEIVSNAMSTQICGDYEQVFELVKQELQASYLAYGKQVLVCKLIPWELDLAT